MESDTVLDAFICIQKGASRGLLLDIRAIYLLFLYTERIDTALIGLDFPAQHEIGNGFSLFIAEVAHQITHVRGLDFAVIDEEIHLY